ncbi:CD82 antigen [Sphaerodactylus townsendi]|uniref:CD82 antigen n=1 Tax=Sphaerodactylus townsendi TaxID=933632 RepID=UPI00202737DC|nr:CD82 antigen [Sphaerodactylus townsendi]
MGSGCLKVTKYFLFLFNLLFFILGAVILGFGIWIMVDKNSFIYVLQTSSSSLKTGAYILIGVGAVTMLMGFLGCLGAVNEIRCLLGLYFTCLFLILIGQIAAGLFIYFHQNALKAEVSGIVQNLVQDYNPNDERNRTIENAWDYVQSQLSCCGWTGPENWTQNTILVDRNQTAYPCSCKNGTKESMFYEGFCDLDIASNPNATFADWPVHKKGCMEGVEGWIQENLGIILGVCAGVAFIELLGMVLSICLCKNIHTEDYTKVPKY